MLRVGELNGSIDGSSVIPAFLDDQRIVQSRKLIATDAYCCSPNVSVEDACTSDGTSESRLADYSAPEIADSDGSDDKGYCSSPVLDPVSFDHCYVSCQRLSWTTDKAKGQVAPRIKTLGSFVQAAEVATKLKQKNGDDRSALSGDNSSPPCESEGEITAGVQAGESKKPSTEDESACELNLNEGDGHEYFTSSVYGQDSSPEKGVHANFEYVKPSGSGTTINLSGGFQQLREAQANSALAAGSGPYERKGSYVCPSAVAYGCPKLQGAILPVKESEKSSNGFSNGVTYSQATNSLNRTSSVVSAPPSTAPILEQARVLPKAGRATFDVDDSNQSVYERIRIALQKAEAQKQLLTAKTNIPSPSPDKTTDEEKSTSTKAGSADKTHKKKNKDSGKEKAPRRYKKKDSPRSTEEDYVTRCLCGFGHNDDFMIQCDRCEVWQHCECLAIKPSNVPEKYLCEICEPRCLPFTSEEASRLQFVKLNASKNGPKKVQERKKRSSGDSLADKEGRKKKARVEESEAHQQCSAELWKLVKGGHNSAELDNLTHKLRPSPPCKVLYVAPDVTGLVVVCALAPNVPILECFGHATLAKESRGRIKAGVPRPNVFLVNNFKVGDSPSIDLCLRFTNEEDQWMQHVRRSCHPNSKISVAVDEKGVRFFLVSTTKIEKGEEVCVPFEYDFRKSTAPITCACTSIHETAREYECPVESFNKELMARKVHKKPTSKSLDKDGPNKRRKSRGTSANDWNSRQSASAKVDSGDSGRSDHEQKPRRARKKHLELLQLQQSSFFDKSGETSEGSVGQPSSADCSKSSSREERKMQFIIERIQRMEDTMQKPKKKRLSKASLEKGSADQFLTSADGSDRESGKSFTDPNGELPVKVERPPEHSPPADVSSVNKARRKRRSSESAGSDLKEPPSEEQAVVADQKEEDVQNAKLESASPQPFPSNKSTVSVQSPSNASSRNAIGINSLLASAVYLNKCDMEASSVLNASPDNAAAEKSKKVRKMSIEEYKRLKRCSFESSKGEQQHDSSGGYSQPDKTASKLPEIQEKPSFFPLCTDESLRSVGKIPTLKPFSIEEHLKGKENTASLSKEKCSPPTSLPLQRVTNSQASSFASFTERNTEPEAGDEVSTSVNRGALADRLDVMRPLFGVQCKEEVAPNPQNMAQLAPQQSNFAAYGPGSYYPAPFGNGVCGQFGSFPGYNAPYAAAPCMLPFGFYSRVPPPPPPATLPQSSIAGATVPPMQRMQPPAPVRAVVPPGYIGNLDYLVMFSGTAAAATTAVALAAADQAAREKQAPTAGTMHRPPRCFGSESDEAAPTSSL